MIESDLFGSMTMGDLRRIVTEIEAETLAQAAPEIERIYANVRQMQYSSQITGEDADHILSLVKSPETRSKIAVDKACKGIMLKVANFLRTAPPDLKINKVFDDEIFEDIPIAMFRLALAKSADTEDFCEKLLRKLAFYLRSGRLPCGTGYGIDYTAAEGDEQSRTSQSLSLIELKGRRETTTRDRVDALFAGRNH